MSSMDRLTLALISLLAASACGSSEPAAAQDAAAWDQARADMVPVSTILSTDYTTAPLQTFAAAREHGVGLGPEVEG